MPPEENPHAEELRSPEDGDAQERTDRSLQKGLTPEIRRRLGGARTIRSRSAADAENTGTAAPTGRLEQPAGHHTTAAPARAAASASTTPPAADARIPVRPRETRPRSTAVAETARPKQRQGGLRVDEQAKRALGLQHIAVIGGALLLLFCAFYVGKNFQYWKYLLATRNAPVAPAGLEDKFPGVAAEDLVEQALAAESAGDWRGAVDRLLIAKYKDRAYRGLFYRIGKILYDKGEHAAADDIFAKAIEFGEDVPMANHHRGLIATAANNLPAAERFLSDAARAEPLVPDHYYHWAEALRLAGKPREAIQRYDQAIVRARTDEVRRFAQLKRRLAQVESGDLAEITKGLETQRAAGPLNVEWLMTGAAMEIQQGRIDSAVQLIGQAREAKNPRAFVTAVRDMFFRKAAQKNPALAEATRLEFNPDEPAFR